MKIMNWVVVEASSDHDRLPAGGYVLKITAIKDNEAREYLEDFYDIAEGDYAGYYSDDWSKQNPWSHRTFHSYKESAQPMFKHFLDCVETSNKHINGFTIEQWQQTCDPQAFVGMEYGAVIGYEKYTKNNGEDGERPYIAKYLPAQDIRNGEFKVPEVKDNRKKEEAAPTAANFNIAEDFPF